jgi:glucose-1-phosphate adenylyltransferase
MKDCLAVVLAGGKGSRLAPLTDDRAKPAVPFGGAYRIIDFSLSNCLNSGFRRILVLTQYKSLSLNRHVDRAWRPLLCRDSREFLDVVAPQQRLTDQWYAGTADAVYQNIYSIEKAATRQTLILAGDHIYKMDYGPLLDFHQQLQADLTIGAIAVPRDAARQFGVIQVGKDGRITGFDEKPDEPATIAGHNDLSLASMGIYVFDTPLLLELLCHDANDPWSAHDFGRNLIPSVINRQRVHAFRFGQEPGGRTGPQGGYWRDVGTIDAYYEANMDLIAAEPELDLYDGQWPVRAVSPCAPPPKIVDAGAAENRCRGYVQNSILGYGTLISGGSVVHSVLGSDVRIGEFAQVEDSLLFNRVEVQRGAKVRRAIIEKNVLIPAGVSVGFDHPQDRERGLTVTESGIVIVTRNQELQSTQPLHSAPLR